jgi:hypothetical protein
MVKGKIWVVAAAMMLVAFGAMASNFRVADQVYVPIAGHIQGGSSLFVSDIFISNLSTDPVSVSIIYGPKNGAGTFQSFANRITLAAGERREYVDFFPTVLPEISSPFGLLVFNGCKQGADCTPDPNNNFTNPNFRPISVESRIYSIAVGGDPKTAASNGQDMPGIPWYNFVSSSESGAGLAKVFITGFRNNTGYRSNLGVLNASQFSSTQLIATLRDGATGNTVGTPHVFNLPPLTFEQSNISALFSIPASAPTTNLYVDMEQGPSSPVVGGPNDAVANGCPDGCPAYLAYGSVLDNQTNDPTTLESQYKQSLTDAQIGCIYNPDLFTCSAKAGQHVMRRAVKH